MSFLINNLGLEDITKQWNTIEKISSMFNFFRGSWEGQMQNSTICKNSAWFSWKCVHNQRTPTATPVGFFMIIKLPSEKKVKS